MAGKDRFERDPERAGAGKPASAGGVRPGSGGKSADADPDNATGKARLEKPQVKGSAKSAKRSASAASEAATAKAAVTSKKQTEKKQRSERKQAGKASAAGKARDKALEPEKAKKQAAKKTSARKQAAKKSSAKKKAAETNKAGKKAGKRAPKTASRPRKDPARRRRGQLAAERARFDLGPAAKVLADELGQLPPGYGLTIVRGFVRDPHHLVAAWDVNDAAAVELAEERGWHSLQLRVETRAGEELARVTVGRRAGVWHLPIAKSGVTVVLQLGFPGAGSRLEEVCRSTPVRLPPAANAAPRFPPSAVALPRGVDIRRVMRFEGPVQPGHRPHEGELSPADRLRARLRFVRQEAEFRPSSGGARPAGASAAGEPAPRNAATGPVAGQGGRRGAPVGAGADTTDRLDGPPSATKRTPPAGGTAPATAPPDEATRAQGRQAEVPEDPRESRATPPRFPDPGPLPSSPRGPFGGGGRPSGEGRSR